MGCKAKFFKDMIYKTSRILAVQMAGQCSLGLLKFQKHVPFYSLKNKVWHSFHKPILNFRHRTFRLDKYILKSLHITSSGTVSVGKQSTGLSLRELKSDLFSWAGPHCEGWGPLGLECTPISTQSCQCIWKKHWAWYRIKATWYHIKAWYYSSLYNSTGSEKALFDSSGIKTPLKRSPLEGSIRCTKTDAPQTQRTETSLAALVPN